MTDKRMTRDALRASLMKAENKKAKSKIIDLFGEQVEIRQPTLAQITKLGKASADDKVPAIARIMIEYLYVPGTDEKVFDAADGEYLAGLPTGQWLNALNMAIEELSGVDVKGAEKNSETTD